MNKNLIETLTGAFVLIVAAWFLSFFMEHNTGVSVTKNHYNLVAKFEQADGISVGTPVRIGGVKVGVVVAQDLDPKTYFAKVTISLNDDIKIPNDSIAKISSDGLIGGKYFAIAPGASDEMLKPGEEMQYTQSSINIESLIGKMIFSKSSEATTNQGNNSSSSTVDSSNTSTSSGH